MKRPTINDWAAVVADQPFTAPELRGVAVVGRLDGVEIMTSNVVKLEGRRITTQSGSVYELGRVHPDYRRFARKHGGVFAAVAEESA